MRGPYLELQVGGKMGRATVVSALTCQVCDHLL